MRNLIKRDLKEAGYEVIGEAKNGREGIKLYFELKPDIVTMDINMPDIDGIEATRQILSKDPHAMIIVITGNNDDEKKRIIMEAGAKEYLQKPFQPAHLWNKLEKMLSSSIVEETKVEAVKANPSNKKVASPLIIQEAVEDNFDDMEIELIEYPEAYQKEIEKEQETYALTKEKLESEMAKKIEIQEEESEEPFLELTSEHSEDEVEEKQVDRTVNDEMNNISKVHTHTNVSSNIKESLMNEPVQKPIIYQPIRQPSTNPLIQPPIYPDEWATHEEKLNQIRPPRPEVNPTITSSGYTEPNKVEVVQVSTKTKNGKEKTKKSKTGVEEIVIRPEENYQVTSKQIDIRPPRGKILMEEQSILPEDEIEEPILNLPEDDNYNKKNNGLINAVKKLFKK